MRTSILERLATERRMGRPRGIYSICSAHPLVLEAGIDQAVEDGSELLVEATCNQVNHLGGYTGMFPADFRNLVVELANRKGLAVDRLILGGDHLGPNPWKERPAEEAMQQAEQMVRAYVEAGFQKIHLDASMACAGDPTPLPGEVVAGRAARLCAVAEQAAQGHKLFYVVGTEVPAPGGAAAGLEDLVITSRAAAAETLSQHRRAFHDAGLASVWPRVIALVVQPGVEFNNSAVADYASGPAVDLIGLLDAEPELVFEAHSTDYQRPEAYRSLVRDGFAILKVGPALSFALREAFEALSLIEAELVVPEKRSQLMDVLELAMLKDRRYWEQHYGGDEQAAHLLRRYSYSDRVRYYWTEPRVRDAVQALLSNLEKIEIPETMLSAYLPEGYRSVRAGILRPDAKTLILDHIRQVMRIYSAACAPDASCTTICV